MDPRGRRKEVPGTAPGRTGMTRQEPPKPSEVEDKCQRPVLLKAFNAQITESESESERSYVK